MAENKEKTDNPGGQPVVEVNISDPTAGGVAENPPEWAKGLLKIVGKLSERLDLIEKGGQAATVSNPAQPLTQDPIMAIKATLGVAREFGKIFNDVGKHMFDIHQEGAVKGLERGLLIQQSRNIKSQNEDLTEENLSLSEQTEELLQGIEDGKTEDATMDIANRFISVGENLLAALLTGGEDEPEEPTTPEAEPVPDNEGVNGG